MRRFAAAAFAIALIFPLTSSAAPTCKESSTECSLQELLDISKNAESLGLSKAEHTAILLEIITELRRIITSFKASAPISYCVNLQNNMVIGSTDAKTNGEVSTLQSFLDRAGVYGDANITGIYGKQTAEAVVRWQQQVGIPDVNESTGVGPLTRKKIREATCPLLQ